MRTPSSLVAFEPQEGTPDLNLNSDTALQLTTKHPQNLVSSSQRLLSHIFTARTKEVQPSIAPHEHKDTGPLLRVTMPTWNLPQAQASHLTSTLDCHSQSICLGFANDQRPSPTPFRNLHSQRRSSVPSSNYLHDSAMSPPMFKPIQIHRPVLPRRQPTTAPLTRKRLGSAKSTAQQMPRPPCSDIEM